MGYDSYEVTLDAHAYLSAGKVGIWISCVYPKVVHQADTPLVPFLPTPARAEGIRTQGRDEEEEVHRLYGSVDPMLYVKPKRLFHFNHLDSLVS